MTGPDEPSSGTPNDERDTARFGGPETDGAAGYTVANTTGASTYSAMDDGEQPVDLSLVQADDALLDALGGADAQVSNALDDQELNAVLLAWRRDIDSEPVPELVDHEYAVATLRTAKVMHKNGKKPRRRMLVPVAAAAAVLAITFGGVGLAARDAQPGDTLWGLTQVLYTDHAKSVQAASTARADLERAAMALSGRNIDEARKALNAAQRAMNKVSEEELADLKAKHAALLRQIGRGPDGGNTGPNKPNPQHPGGDTSSPDSSAASQPTTTPSPDDTSPSTPPDSTDPSTPPTSSGNSGTSNGTTDEGTGDGRNGDNELPVPGADPN